MVWRLSSVVILALVLSFALLRPAEGNLTGAANPATTPDDAALADATPDGKGDTEAVDLPETEDDLAATPEAEKKADPADGAEGGEGDPAESADEKVDSANAAEESQDAPTESADDKADAADATEEREDAPTESAKEKGDSADAAEGGEDAPIDSTQGEEAAPVAESAVKSTKKIVSGEDLPVKGNCSTEIQTHCKDIPPGASALVDCISNRIKIEKAGNDDTGLPISAGCKSELRAFKIEMYKDVTMDKKMEKACKKDITKFCDDDFLYPETGNIVACLREVNQVDTVSEACKTEILRAQLDGANDFKLDPQLNELCSGEAERLCKDVKPGEGRVQECLRANRQKLAWDCQAELFRQEVENVEDIRLNVRLFKACFNDKKKFCPEVVPGDARVKDCLEDHRLDADFSPQCKAEFDKMMERRASDFRLDPTLRKFCKQDISEICYPDAEDITDVASWDAKVIQCLQDYRDELKDPKCQQQVHKVTKRAAEDIRFDKPLADACYSDRNTLCKDVPDGMAQVFRCLQDHRDQLKEVCRSALFDQEVRMAEDIDFHFAMKQACSHETKALCKDLPQGHAAIIKCLREKINDADMGDECKKEVKRDQLRSAEDYRLNYRLNKACFNDVQRMCLHACEKAFEVGSVTCGGEVLKCLSENKDKLESDACKKEVFAFEKEEVSDIRLDRPLQAACKADLEKHCSDVSRDHSRTLACLRSHKDQLAEECKAEEERFSIMEASDIRLTPTLMNACGQELQMFCKDVPPTDGQSFKCLQSKLEEIGMGAACKGEVNLQEIRHASNYRLDVRVRKECEGDVARFCADVDKGHEGHALVLRCFADKYKKLSASCATEVAYSVRMALWQYSLGAELTQACDPVVESKCQTDDIKAVKGVVIGKYGQCLTQQRWKDLQPDCRKLIKIVSKEGAHAGSIDDSKLQETLNKIAELQANIGEPKTGGLVLSGWVAFAAIMSLVVVILGLGYFAYRKYSGYKPYTLVVKGGDV